MKNKSKNLKQVHRLDEICFKIYEIYLGVLQLAWSLAYCGNVKHTFKFSAPHIILTTYLFVQIFMK